MKIALVLAVALLACGDNNKAVIPDGPQAIDAAVDAPMAAATLTTYVIDLITNHTSSTILPHPFSEFSTLPDPDGVSNNTAAYNSLFP